MAEATEDELYAAMDWLLERQQSIEEGLARRYLTPGGVVLYDLTSTYVEGDHCPLAKRGYSRDGKPGKQQIEFGLLTNGEGVPVAIEAFAGTTADSTTFRAQVQKVRGRFGVDEARIPHLVQTSDSVNRQLSCFSSRYMNLLAVFQTRLWATGPQ